MPRISEEQLILPSLYLMGKKNWIKKKV